jgi:hypothetical protein
MTRIGSILVILMLNAVLFGSEVLDRIVATVDKHAIMRSDVEQEARFTHFLAGQTGEITGQDEIAALGRLVDRDLVADQVAVFGAIPVTKQEIASRIAQLRAQIAGAESEAGWQQLLKESGLEEEDVENRIAEEIRTLRFIDMRFRSEVRVGPRSIQNYYDSKFVPEMKSKNLVPPPLDEVRDKIEAILREERVNTLISDWLKGLRSQTRIQSFDPSLPLSGIEKKAPDVSDLRFLPLRLTGPTEAAKQP